MAAETDLTQRQLKALELVFPTFMKSFEPRDVVPTLVARHAFLSADMTQIYGQSSRQERVKKFTEILKRKSNWWCPFIDALIRTGHNSLAEKLIGLVNNQQNVNGTCNGVDASPVKEKSL